MSTGACTGRRALFRREGLSVLGIRAALGMPEEYFTMEPWSHEEDQRN
jgi:hypothetical protein